jgi:hypothetical protein
MSERTTLTSTPAFICSPASGAGTSHYALRGGLTTDPCGPAPVPASPSRRRGSGAVRGTPGTCGRRCSDSSASAALSASLASRLRTVVAQHGSTLYRMTWRESATGSGRLRIRLAASARRTCGCERIGWPTCRANDAEKRGLPSDDRRNGLVDAAVLSGWPSCAARDTRDGRSNQHGKNKRPLNEVALLAASGPPATGCPAETGKRGQLSPELPCWLMGFPIEWVSCGVLVTPSSSRRRRRS